MDDDKYRKRLGAGIARSRQLLADWEDGSTVLGKRLSSGEWVETTPDFIDHEKTNIEMLEGILARVAARSSGKDG